MNITLSTGFPLIALGALLCCAPTRILATDQTHSTPQSTRQEDLGCDFFNGKTNKIVRVTTVTPTHVRVTYEGTSGGRNIPRHELNSPLKERYPYDPQAAADFIKKQSNEVQARTTAQRQALEQRVRELEIQLSALDKQWKETQRELNAIREKRKVAPHAKVLKRSEVQLIEQRKELGRRRTELQEKVQAMQKQADGLR
jgi:chromosome segregation ATPase